MSTIIGLAKARKQRARDAKKAAAAANSVKFGRTKAEKRQDAAELARQASLLSAHKREDT